MNAVRHLAKAFLAAILAVFCLSCNKTALEAPDYFIGTNLWYGAILGAPDGTPGSDRGRLVAELDSLCSIGVRNIRVLVGADGPEGSDVKVRPSLQREAGVYNEDLLSGMDFLLSEMGKRSMKAVLYINNTWEWSGGYGSYLEWAGRGVTPNTRADGYPAFMEYVSRFVTDTDAQELFFNNVRFLVNRFKYSDSIYSWQIANEPRCFSYDPLVQDAFVDLLWKSAALIKSVDPGHMVSTGNEGYYGCQENYDLYERIHSCPDIDYMTIHIWPYNWSWIRENSVSDNLQAAIDSTDSYIDRHLEIARRLGKKLVIEEFGYPRDEFQFAKESPVTARNAYYSHIFSRVEESQKSEDALLGVNFWGWGGLASQNNDHLYWEDGDDYCGDPAQEQQGLNSVYMSDSATVGIIRDFTARLAGNVYADVPVQDGWIYSEDVDVVLDASVRCQAGVDVPCRAVVLTDLSLMSENKDTVVVAEALAKTSKCNCADVSFNLGRLAPGFYRVNIVCSSPTGQEVKAKTFNIGCSPEKIVSEKDAQPDFDEFWDKALAELSEVPLEYSLEPMPEYSDSCRNVWRLEMKSVGGATIGGIYAEPVKDGKYPAYIEYMGYGASVYPYYGCSKPDAIQFLVSVRNQGIFIDKPRDWADRGISSPDTYYYRGAYCDVVRAVDFIASREKTDTSRIFGLGESQGGAFTWVAASLDHRFRAIAPAVPFMSDFPDYGRIVWWPVWEMKSAASQAGVSEEEFYRILSYFDVKNFTERITCPVKMAFGLQDPVCPPHTNFAGYNMVKSQKSYKCVPLCDHSIWTVKEWQEERQEWFDTFQ